MTVCPCGSGTPFATCCEPWLDGGAAPTAEALMRSRYTAYTLLQRGDARAETYLARTWHPRTRPRAIESSPGLTWTGLTIHEVSGGESDADTGMVAFTARWTSGEGSARQRGELSERSRFARRAGRWVYVDAET
ncbi:YchJ family protein [Janibacter sp. GXQ6167]|uniref:YchJ family protein n=1 Tax=Janibacter sp. GXQ6167 TaxID=3240791 RepID=UPI003525C056